MSWLRGVLPTLCMLPLSVLLACPAGDDDDSTGDEDQFVNTTIELADIFIPDRLVEIPVLPAGSEVIHEVFVHNAGDQALTIYGMRLDYQSDANWQLDASTVPDSIEPHGVAVVKVNYTAAVAADTFAALEIESDDVDEAVLTVAFIGRQATGGPVAKVSGTILDWGFQFRGEERRKLLTIRNHGDEDLHITGVELIQSEDQIAFHVACHGQALEDCDWQGEVLPQLLQDPIVPGSGALFELAFVPTNLQATSAQLRLHTNDPLRPEFTVFLLGNGESSLNCTPPRIEVTSPQEAAFFHSFENLVVTARVIDDEQPPDSLYVELFIGDLPIEDEFPDANGLVEFNIDIDDHEPPLPAGLQPLTLRVTDGCPTFGFDAAVVAIDFPLSANDIDGDGYSSSQGDCDDNNADAFPQNVETFDGVDNDCDATIDEGTVVWDNDCDGYCKHPTICLGQAEFPGDFCQPLQPAGSNGGDCNDSRFDLNHDDLPDGNGVHPGADELLNFVDDDCDGITDEETTFFDDDGDGLTEATGDCDDSNPDIFKGAVEWCDDLDNDCNGPVDDLCVERDPPPRIVGGVLSDRFQVELGSRARTEVLVVSGDPNLTYAWQSDRDGFFDDPTAGPAASWNAPEDNEDNRSDHVGQFVNVWVKVTDSNGNSDTAFGNLLISSSITTTFSPIDTGGNGCSLGGRGPGALGLLLLGVGLLRRRR